MYPRAALSASQLSLSQRIRLTADKAVEFLQDCQEVQRGPEASKFVLCAQFTVLFFILSSGKTTPIEVHKGQKRVD